MTIIHIHFPPSYLTLQRMVMMLQAVEDVAHDEHDGQHGRAAVARRTALA